MPAIWRCVARDVVGDVKEGLAFLSVLAEPVDGEDLDLIENARYTLGPACRKNFGRTGRQLTMIPVAISARVQSPITMML